MKQIYYIFGFFILVFFSCKQDNEKIDKWETITVIATAYNSLAYQTNSNPLITAFGDSLKPGLKYIAVSRDLLKLGLTHNTQVKIEGFEDIYLVKDKMNRRWKNRIDIYMGNDIKAAKKWGKQKVEISYRVEVVKDSKE